MSHSALYRRLALALQSARNENLKEQGLPGASLASGQGWSRRRFLKTTGLAGLGGVAAGMAPGLVGAALAAGAGKAPNIAVIGAGIAGLNAAYQLRKAGVMATVYEASNRVGGRMRSVSNALDAGLTINIGAELINTDHADMLTLVKEFGIQLFNRKENAIKLNIPQEAYWFNGKAYSEAQLAEDLRPLAKQIAADSALLDSDYDKYAPAFDKLSVQDYLDQHASKIKAAYVRSLIDNTIRTEYGVEPENSSALQLLFILPTVKGQAVDVLSYSDEVYSAVGGSSVITDALAKALPGQIKTGKYLTGIQAAPAGFRLSFADNSVVAADAVIIAIPFTVLRNIFIDAPLPPKLRQFIDEATLGANEKLIAGFNKRFWHRADGFGLEAWTDLGYSEVWDECQGQTNLTAGALNFFMGGSEVLDAQDQVASSLGKKFIAGMETFLPGAVAASTGEFVRSRWLQNYLSFGAYSSFKPGQLTRFADYFWVEASDPTERQEVSAGRLLFAGEHVSDAYYGFMNGGAQTGRLAAEAVLRKLALA